MDGGLSFVAYTLAKGEKAMMMMMIDGSSRLCAVENREVSRVGLIPRREFSVDIHPLPLI